MTILQTWFFDGQFEKRPGAPNRIAPDSFTLRITKPTSANTGPRIAESSLANYAGSFTNATSAKPITGLAITGQIDANANNIKFSDSLILMGANPDPGTTYLGIKATNAAMPSGMTFEFCEIRPSVQTVDHYGIQGRGFTLYRCEITGVVDGAVVHGTTTTQGAVSIQGCFIHGLAHYEVDPRQSGTPSHDDGIQVEGALDFEAIGNTILGGYTSAILITQNVAHPDNYIRVTIEDNWLDQENPVGGAVVNISEKDRGPINNLTIAGNRFGRTGSGFRMIMPSTTRLAATTIIPTSGPRANVYEDNGAVVAITNG